MSRTFFVAWLYVSAVACVLIGLSEQGWAWWIGAVVFVATAELARRRLRTEAEQGAAAARLGFVLAGIAVTLTVMVALFWLQFRA